VRQVSWYS